MPESSHPTPAPFGDGLPPSIGPILFARGGDHREFRLTALFLAPSWRQAPKLVAGAQEIAGRPIAEIFGWSAHAYDFALPARKGASYELGGRTYPVCADLSGDMRLAFVSCNGQEEGDADRPLEVRNRMWRRLLTEHGERPFSLLVQGGDQLYADEAMRSHPETARWKKAPNRKRPGIAFTPEMRLAARRWYAERYLRLAAEPAMAEIVARVPSMMMWDDHDIMDGWGSHPAAIQESPVGIGLFEVAREMFKLFQLGLGADEPMPLAPSPSEAGFTFGARFPGLSILVPDLRSERSLTRVMGPEGWRAFDRLLEDVGEGDRVVLVSTVPVLGPRLSVVERLLNKMPKAQDYEDDLRDQWQSYAHRLEWVRLLESLERVAQTRGAAVTVLSGEIHLATRGTMSFRGGAGELHQLVASGITHPEPSSLYAGGLGLLARFGESPVPGCPIRMRPLPGKSATYTAERNYLVLDRQGGRWTAEWELEKSGRTKSLAI